MNKQFVLPQTALKLRDAGFPQGNTEHLWHKEKGCRGWDKFPEQWVIYKRNKHDISAFGDSHGYNRWVSAPTIEQAQRWGENIREMHREAKTAAYEMLDMIQLMLEIMDWN